jgi:hypothetical protein
MTEPFADEQAPGVDASEAAGPAVGSDAVSAEDPAVVSAEDPAVVSAEDPALVSAEGPAVVEPDEEVVDGLPVIAEVRTIDRPSHASLPAVQAAAAAATGFVAGAATIALIKRRSARKVARNGKGGARRAIDLLPITASRSFLVDVHVIGKQGD